eukprot:jgi/Mesvir1/4855/Mv11130-RA.1
MGYEPATWRLATTFIAGEPGLSSLHAAQPIQIKETASAGQKGFVATMSKGTPRLPPCNRGVLTPGGSQKSYDVFVPLILDVPVGNDIIEVKCCHRAMRQLLGIQHSVWRTYLAQAAASFSMPVDGDVLDYHGLTEEDLADVAKHPGGSSAKEQCAAWQMDFAKECGDYDPARAANEILLGDLNMKQCWEHGYKEDLRLECGEDEALFKSLCLSYSPFMKCWKQVALGNYWPGSPKIRMLEYTRNVGVCQTCVLLRTLRRGAGSGERRKRYDVERRKHMALVRRERLWQRDVHDARVHVG